MYSGSCIVIKSCTHPETLKFLIRAHGINSKVLDLVHELFRVHVSQFMIVQDKVQFKIHFVLVLAQPSRYLSLFSHIGTFFSVQQEIMHSFGISYRYPVVQTGCDTTKRDLEESTYHLLRKV